MGDFYMKAKPTKEVQTEPLDLDTTQSATVAMDGEQEIVLAEVDFNELLELEKETQLAQEQLNKLSGAIFRIQKDQETIYNHEKTLGIKIETKKRELLKRYKIDEAKQWKVDLNTRKVIYTK